MNKKSLIAIVSVLGAAVFAVSALAATTVSFSPSSVHVASDERFDVVVSVNSQGMNNYAEKVELRFPADVLEVTSFTLANSWMALTQSGYDLTDNTKGILIKSAGYPGGFSGSMTFGTISFRALRAGSGTITIGDSSLAFDASGQSVINGTPASVSITVPAVSVTPSVTPIPTSTLVPQNVVSHTIAATQSPTPQATPSQVATTQSNSEEASAVHAENSRSFLATVGTAVTLGTNNFLVGVGVLLMLGAAAFFVRAKFF